MVVKQQGQFARPAEFGFRLDEHSGVPVYRQLIDQVQAAIATGALKMALTSATACGSISETGI